MHTIRNAYLAYGQVYVPVAICTAQKRQDISFKTLHGDPSCLGPISTERQCTSCQKGNLQLDEVVKGFEFAKGQFVVVEEEAVKALKEEPSRVIQIRKFVVQDAIDELSLDKSYFLKPGELFRSSYAMVSEALRRGEVAGLGTTSLNGKEYPVMVWVRPNGVLVLSMLYCHDEVVDDSEITSILGGVSILDEDQEDADQYIIARYGELKPEEDLVSHSRGRVSEYIASKVTGARFEFAEPEPDPVATINISEAIKASMAEARLQG